jgi:hypothetical protein
MLQVPETGWSHGRTWLPLAALLAAAAFVQIERRSSHPMLDLSLFRYPRFVGVQLLAAAPAYAFVVLLVLLPLRFIGVEGLAPLAAGQRMFVLSLPMLFVPLLAGWLSRWLSAAPAVGRGCWSAPRACCGWAAARQARTWRRWPHRCC